MPTKPTPIVSVESLEKWFTVGRSLLDIIRRKPAGRIHAVDGVSLHLLPNEVLGIVGESGSGKSTLARCLVALYRPDRGRIVFDGVDVTEATGQSRRDLHGRMQMIYQDPYTSLNPQMSIGAAIGEAGRVHGRAGEDFMHELFDVVGLPRSMAGRRPRALSGGQRQRAAIARALAVQPEVLIADEAVSALDVSIQAQILNLFSQLSDDLGLAMIFIAHDLAVVSHVADRVAIMYLGRIVEEGPLDAVFGTPKHPYTRALLDAHPDPYALGRGRRDRRNFGGYPFASRHPLRMPIPDPLSLCHRPLRGGRSCSLDRWRAASSRMSRAAVRTPRLGLGEGGLQAGGVLLALRLDHQRHERPHHDERSRGGHVQIHGDTRATVREVAEPVRATHRPRSVLGRHTQVIDTSVSRSVIPKSTSWPRLVCR